MEKQHCKRQEEEGDDDKEGGVTEVGQDLAEIVIPGDQVQKCSEKGEATGLQRSAEMSKMQWKEEHPSLVASGHGGDL